MRRVSGLGGTALKNSVKDRICAVQETGAELQKTFSFHLSTSTCSRHLAAGEQDLNTWSLCWPIEELIASPSLEGIRPTEHSAWKSTEHRCGWVFHHSFACQGLAEHPSSLWKMGSAIPALSRGELDVGHGTLLVSMDQLLVGRHLHHPIAPLDDHGVIASQSLFSYDFI